jgi:hypothetical protein
MGLGSPDDLAEADLCRLWLRHRGVCRMEITGANDTRWRREVATLAGYVQGWSLTGRFLPWAYPARDIPDAST